MCIEDRKETLTGIQKILKISGIFQVAIVGIVDNERVVHDEMILDVDHGSEAKARIETALTHRARLAVVSGQIARHERDEDGEHADEE